MGSFTPSMANISRPMRPWRSHTASTAAKLGAIWSPSGADEVGDCREVGARVAAQGNERDVLLAGPGDRPAAHQSAGVGEEHHPRQHARRVGGRARRIVAIPDVEWRQIDRLFEQLVQGMLESAGEQLGGEVDRDELRLRIDRLVTRHGGSRRGTDETAHFLRGQRVAASGVPFPHRSRGLFLQPR